MVPPIFRIVSPPLDQPENESCWRRPYLDILSKQLVFRLGGSKQIGCQFRASHVVQDVLLGSKPFQPLNAEAIKAARPPQNHQLACRWSYR
jgi:hypothetical protein